MIPTKPVVSATAASKVKSPWQIVTIKKGDSLAKIFANLNIPYIELQKILSLQSANEYLDTLKPGDKLYFNFDVRGPLFPKLIFFKS